MARFAVVTVVLAALFGTGAAFAPRRAVSRAASTPMKMASVDSLLLKVESTGLLTKVAESGILSKAEAAGFTPASIEPLLVVADDLGLAAVVPDLLESPLAATAVDLAPSALPLVSTLLSIPAPALTLAALGSLGAAAGEIYLIPDDSTVLIAAQAFLFVILGAVVPGASLLGAAVLGSAK